ncbi:MAG: hypothetical protein IJN24_00860 [Bacteroidaceae bacterium]|nr:hypothetical protein [Bacteroidaceae bacterium]
MLRIFINLILFDVMEFKENFDKLTNFTQQYIDLKVDDVKLHVIENLSVLCGDLLSFVVVSVFAVLSLFFLIVAGIICLVPLVGLLWSVIIAVALLAVVSSVLYFARRKIFANVMVGRFCRMFFPKDDMKDE